MNYVFVSLLVLMLPMSLFGQRAADRLGVSLELAGVLDAPPALQAKNNILM